MIQRLLLLLAFSLPLLAHARAGVEQGLLRAVPEEGERLQLAERMKHYGVPGVSIAVWQNGKLDWTAGYGDVQADTLLRAGALAPLAKVASKGKVHASGTGADGERIPPDSFDRPWITAADAARALIKLQKAKKLPAASAGGNDPGFYAKYATDGSAGVVVLANHEHAATLADEIVRAVARDYRWSTATAAPRKSVTVDASKFAARYKLDPDDVVRFRSDGAQLVLTRTGVLAEGRLDAVGDNEFVDRDTGTTYVFANDTVTFGGLTAKRTREAIPAELTDRDPPTGVMNYGFIDKAYLTEERLRARGIAFLRRSNYGAAVAILKLNVERHPQSAAAHDALATAQLATNDKAGARASSQRVLDVLADDTTVSTSWRQVYRKRAERRLAQ
ncbi:MAG TPA: hypothetical protein VF883_03430 [Thermoanaerobaculia bacterium]|jgi:hypothetical protein